mmetsp:Transcript_11280/g.27760  ORF Transcript_11280/g.27760 Transcript_11280/m.27760 type:complete len:358 (+) Transcript_11280:1-1074(+)
MTRASQADNEAMADSPPSPPHPRITQHPAMQDSSEGSSSNAGSTNSYSNDRTRINTIDSQARRTLILGMVANTVGQTLLSPLKFLTSVPRARQELIRQGMREDRWPGTVAFTSKILKQRGWTVLFTGNSLQVLTYLPYQMLDFVVNKNVVKIVNRILGITSDTNIVVKIFAQFFSGILTGGISVACRYPIITAREKFIFDEIAAVAIPKRKRRYIGFRDFVKKALASRHNLNQLTHGFLISAVGLFVRRFSYFYLYNSVSPWLRGKGTMGYGLKSGFVARLIAIVAGLVAFPMDTIRNRQVMAAGTEFEYRNALDCARQIYKEGEIVAFYEGSKWVVAGGFASTFAWLGLQTFLSAI